MRLLAATIAILLATTCIAQPQHVEYLYGSDTYDVLTVGRMLANGAVVLAGTSPPGMDSWQDVYIELLQQDGYSISTTFSFGGGRWDEPRDIAAATDGGFIIVGSTRASWNEPHDMMVVRVINFNEIAWSYTYGEDGNDSAVRVFGDEDGYTILGFTRPAEWDRSDFRMLRLNLDGTELWHQDYGGDRDEICTAGDRAADGSYLIAGYTHSWESEDQDLYMLHVDPNGNVLHEFYQVEPYPTVPYAVVSADDGFLVAGTVYRFPELEMPSPFLMKINLNGEILWQREYLDSYFAEARSLTTLGDTIVVAGFAYDGGLPDGWVLWTDMNGERVQESTFGGDGWEEFRAAVVISDVNLMLAGFSSSTDNHESDFYRVHVGSDNGGTISPIPERYTSEISVWPNPFNSVARVRFTVGRATTVKLMVYDLLGREVMKVAEHRVYPGEHNYMFNGDRLASGVYLVRALAEDHTSAQQKIVLVK